MASCPSGKYPKLIEQYANAVLVFSHQVCKWKNPMCDDTASDGTGSCLQCSFSYPAAVLLTNSNSGVSSCNNYCPVYSTKGVDLTCSSCPSNCRRCKPDMTCLKCLDNYVINHPSLLTSSNIMTDSCLLNTCPTGFYSDSLQCQACQTGCDVCLLDGSCYTCATNYVLDAKTKTCYPSGCQLNQFYDGVCNNCAAECQTCSVSMSQCTSCAINTGNQTYLANGACVTTCPLGTFAHLQSRSCRLCDPRCLSCSSHRNCTSCANDFYLLAFYDNTNTPCVSECPVGFYVNGSNICSRCHHDCKSCYGPSEYQCIECYPNFFLDEGKCVYFCSAMKYQDQGSGHCEWCHSSCQECWGPTKHHCLSCQSNHYIYNHVCYAWECPGATYLSIPEQRLCEPCQFGCQICTSSQFCEFCTPGYNFYQGWCYLNHCPGNLQPVISYYYNKPPVLLQGTICQYGCSDIYSSNCLNCDANSCITCKGNLYLLRSGTATIT